jgi:asparagine synthase (glutamine-hydrolysing)
VQAQPDAYLRSFFHLNGEGPCFSHEPRWSLTSKLKTFFSREFRNLFAQTPASDHIHSLLPDGFEGWDWLSRAQYLETVYLLPSYLLSSQGDRMAMAHAVEGRFPFLDSEVAAFALRLPTSLKLKVLKEKYLLKQTARHLVPPAVFKRFKQPYRAPEGASFFRPRPSEYVEELLSARQLTKGGVFDPTTVGRLVNKFRSGAVIGARDNMALIGILSTQLVIHQFIDHRRN